MKREIFNSCDDGITRALNQQLSRNITPCAKCGSKERKLGAGKAPGQSSLLCECGKFIKWLSAKEASTIASHKGEARS